ncbi:MAG: glycosyltransferase family 4 protein [Rubellimicrobium sp.]|nr:glycosyltransferase family 4 protein [Rubellimicrobium sp.]
MADRPRRILIVAEQANPEWVSVPLIGWSLARALAQVAEVHLVTHSRNRDAILRAGLTEGRDFTVIDSDRIAAPLWRLAEALGGRGGKGHTILQAAGALAYPWFEHLLWRRFGARIRAGEWDVVHRITPLSPTATGPLAAHCARAGVPHVIGPLNGGVPWPAGFDGARRREREWLVPLRGLYRLMPGRARMLRACAAIIAGSRHTLSEIPARHRDRAIWLPENAVDPARFPPGSPPADGRLRACFIGRMVPYKGPDMLLEAAAPLIARGRLSLEMIGDGPMLPALRERAAALGLERGIAFHGWVAHDRVQEVAGGCHILAFPSIREFGGGVVLEAMAMGLAPVVVDYAGPGELVDADTGWKIALSDRAGIVAGLGAVLAELADHPERARARGNRARARVLGHFTWAAKARQVLAIHDWALGRSGRPDPFAPAKEAP